MRLSFPDLCSDVSLSQCVRQCEITLVIAIHGQLPNSQPSFSEPQKFYTLCSRKRGQHFYIQLKILITQRWRAAIGDVEKNVLAFTGGLPPPVEHWKQHRPPQPRHPPSGPSAREDIIIASSWTESLYRCK